MSKSSGGAASVESIEDAICDNRMFAERTFYCIANGAGKRLAHLQKITNGAGNGSITTNTSAKWRKKHDQYL